MKAKTNDKPKKPLVNWFKREKEVEYGTKKIGYNTTVNTKTKVVKAPESKVSKGFTKTVQKVSRKQPISESGSNKNIKRGVGVLLGGAALGFGGAKTASNRAERKKNEDQEAIYRQGKQWGDQTAKINEMEKKRDANYEKRGKAATALGLLIPASFGVGVGIASKSKERKTSKVVTKIYNDGSGSKKDKSDGKVQTVKKYKKK
jgi:hypothetical protein